ncbi:phage tail tape measure protein [uncultured Clostridium sp.]|uniref:phage tail tape measure protein n=1 Tax=uncultured Clostridium sp. TaxID=59620 RepID=UPI00258D5769|nr:phage tail tape measure protein [uncultured Clostridium sp.]
MSANVKIGANTSSFQKQMSDMARQLKMLSSEFSVSATKAKLFGSVQDQLKAKQSELTAKIKVQNSMVELQQKVMSKLTGDLDKQKLKREELNKKITETTNKYKESVSATGKNSEESKKLKDELTKLKESYAQNEKAIDTTNKKLDTSQIKMNNVKKAVMENEKALEGVNSKLKNLKIENISGNLNKVSKTTGNIANKLLPFATIIGATGVAASKFSMDFETGMHKVYTIADRSVVPVIGMKKAVLDLSNQMGVSSVEIENNVYDAISAGQKTGDAVNFVKNSTKLATAGFAEAGQSLDLLTTILNAYGMKASEVTNVSDKLITTQNLGKVTVAQLSESMGKVIPTAKAYHVNLSQVTSGYALMTSKGIKAAETTTYMNSMFNELGKSGTNASTALKSATGKTFQQLMASGHSLGDVLNSLSGYAKKNGKSLADMFGSAEAGKAALVLSENAGKDFNEMLKQMNNSAGATDKAFKEVSNTTEFNLKKALNQGKNAMIGFGDVIAPFISLAAQGISKITKAFDGMSEGQKKVTVGIGATIMGFTGAFFGISKFTGAMSEAIKNYGKIKNVLEKLGVITKVQTALQWLLNTAAAAFPYILIIAGIGLVVAGFIHLWKTSASFRNFWIGLWNGIKESCNNAANWITKKFDDIGKWFNSIPGKISSFFNKISNYISSTLNRWGNNISNFFTKKIPSAFKKLGTYITNFIKSIPSLLVEFASMVEAWKQKMLFKLGHFLGFALGRIVKWGIDVWNFFTKTVPQWINYVEQWFSQLPGRIYKWLVNTYHKVVAWGNDMINKAIETASNFINNFITWVSQLPGRIQNYLINTYNNVVAWGSNMINKAIETASNFINNFLNWISQLPGRLSNWLSNSLNSVVNWGYNLYVTGRNAAINLVNSIVDEVKSLPSKMMNLGSYIVHGLWQGILNAKNNFMAEVRSFCGGIISGFKEGLGIHSPARKMIPIGDFTIQGVDVGMNKAMPKLLDNVKDKMSNLAGKMKATINTEMPDINGDIENKFSLNTNLSKDDLNNINSRLNTKTNNKVIVLVENKTILDGEVIGTKTYKKVAKKMQDDENSYKVTQGKRGYTFA